MGKVVIHYVEKRRSVIFSYQYWQGCRVVSSREVWIVVVVFYERESQRKIPYTYKTRMCKS